MSRTAYAHDLSDNAVEIVDLADEHLERAAMLFADRYQEARSREQMLPPGPEHPERLLPKLRQLVRQGPGVAAMRRGRMVGFMAGQLLPSFRGMRSIYMPEWAHALAADAGDAIHRAMYAYLSGPWVADGCCQHVITLLADDRVALDASAWLGFGMAGADTVRDLTPVPEEPSDVRIRRATVADIDSLLHLGLALQAHLRAAPIFLSPSPLNRQAVEGYLADPNDIVLLAERDNAPVACLRVKPAGSSDVWVLDDPGTATIGTTFTVEAHRGRGVCTALLNRALAWARDSGLVRCAVGFESANMFACRFWLRHFHPVCYSLIRHIHQQPTQSGHATETIV